VSSALSLGICLLAFYKVILHALHLTIGTLPDATPRFRQKGVHLSWQMIKVRSYICMSARSTGRERQLRGTRSFCDSNRRCVQEMKTQWKLVQNFPWAEESVGTTNTKLISRFAGLFSKRNIERHLSLAPWRMN
jgi:hypothetical protein